MRRIDSTLMYSNHTFFLQCYDLNSENLTVTHYHFTSWPDFGVPDHAMPFLKFIIRVRKDHDKNKNVPLLVHCSAGVGRTGVFILIDSMIDQLMVEDSINVYEFVRQMRKKRVFMVQTEVRLLQGFTIYYTTIFITF